VKSELVQEVGDINAGPLECAVEEKFCAYPRPIDRISIVPVYGCYPGVTT
jgi:hypothetical protein